MMEGRENHPPYQAPPHQTDQSPFWKKMATYFPFISFFHFRLLALLCHPSRNVDRSLSPRKGYSFFIIFIFSIFAFRDFGRPAQAWGSRPARKPDFGGRGPPGPPRYT